MAEYIKLNNSWIEIYKVFKKINNVWSLQTNLSSSISNNTIYICNSEQIDEVTYVIYGTNSYTGKTFNLQALFNNQIVPAIWSIISGSQYASINSNGKVTISEGIQNQSITVKAIYGIYEETKTITISYDNQLVIESADTISGTVGNVIARYNSIIVTPTWSITSGNAYATIDSSGNITIISSGTITVSASYNTYTTTKNIELLYDTGASTETSIDEHGNITTETSTISTDLETGATTITTTTVISNDDGSSSTTNSEMITNQDGSSQTTTTTTNSDGSSVETTVTVSAPDSETGSTTTDSISSTTNSDGTSTEIELTTITNLDGSSSSNSTTTNYDVNGDTIGSSENTTVNNVDGSSTSSTINYNAEGDPTNSQNNQTDTSGNSSTQNITYDENGDPTVTGYTIDTSGNTSNGVKTFNGDGVNTEYYAFDVTHGFILDFNFTIDFKNQPTETATGGNHHQILSMKRADPEPWYGFQLRHSTTNTYIQLGTQFATGSNTNTTINPTSVVNNVAEYNLRIIYNPNLVNESKFVCRDLLAGSNSTVVFEANNTFPDLPELRYLKVLIGYGLNSNGDPYRYSNINVINFSIKQISNTAAPVIYCINNLITMSTETSGASIYYRIGSTGNYNLYTDPIQISQNVTVQAYADLNNELSDVITQLCRYDNGILEPIIYCDGQYVSITCDTPSVDIYYRLNQTGNYNLYADPIQISQNTIVEAYAELNNEVSTTVNRNCIYVDGVAQPIIACDGEYVTISCVTPSATIYYRLGTSGNYSTYSTSFAINADTTVQAYATLGQQTSPITTSNCTYNPIHHYENDYLTFKVITAGTIVWKAFGSGYTKTIQYSLNDGAWTSITASSGGASISVAANDVVRFKGSNTTYAGSKNNYDGFDGGTATFNIEGNIMSLIYGDDFIGNNVLTGTYNFCSMFKQTKVVSAANLILPSTTLTGHCYRALFSKSPTLEVAPALPATTLATYCYWYMFEECLITNAPDLPAQTLVTYCYGHMFEGCSNLNYVKCLATGGFTQTDCKANWLLNVSATGTFVKDENILSSTWGSGASGIPSGWQVVDNGIALVSAPEIGFDGENIIITCITEGSDIYYRLGQSGSYNLYTVPISINSDTVVEAYAELNGQASLITIQICEYLSNVPIEYSNRSLNNWTYDGVNITPPYSVNAIDGRTSSYAKGTFTFETNVALRSIQPTYLWFQHADQSATIYVNNTLVNKHWGGYNSFFMNISNYVQTGSNDIKVILKNNEGNYLAPAAGDFNYNATLGKVKLYTSPVLPDPSYGYDGFHVTSTVSSSSATINVKTSIPIGATVVCSISDGTYNWSDSKPSTGEEMTFTTTISGANLRLWNGTIDPHLYTITLEIYKDNSLYHRYQRGYGLRYYSYVINEQVTVNGSTTNYTGFLLNGSPYLLRGVCMHHDIEGKANALSDTDIANDFNIIQELGCNFIRLAHYPHPKEVYDWCDQLGIIVQTEVPCVNKMQSTMPSDYYTHLTDQYTEMVNEHYNHPSIIFWGLSNETTTDDKAFAKTKIESYASLIKGLDTERWVGYVMSHNVDNPSSYYNNPSNIDWFGCNLYVGWYIDQTSNNPSNRLNTRITNIITNLHKPLAYSEYGCGGTQNCHSENFLNTTTRGNNARHDIEYQMWLHEGHIDALKNYPQLLFTGQWQLFDIAVSNRNEGYTICPDGENASTDDTLRRLNNKGLVERDHITKKDTFYLYKAWWNPTPFIHICGKDYTKKTDRVIKCYTNGTGTFSLYVNPTGQNDTAVATATAANYIVEFTGQTFNEGDVIKVIGPNNIEDSFTI